MPVLATSEEQLFNISFELSDVYIYSIEDLTARVNFTDFGTVATPVNMTFDILNSSDKIVDSQKGDTVVKTNSIFNKTFSGITLKPGFYTLRLTTLYNADVENQFRQSFEIRSQEGSYLASLSDVAIPIGIIATGLIISTFIILFVMGKRRKNKKDGQDGAEI